MSRYVCIVRPKLLQTSEKKNFCKLCKESGIFVGLRKTDLDGHNKLGERERRAQEKTEETSLEQYRWRGWDSR